MTTGATLIILILCLVTLEIRIRKFMRYTFIKKKPLPITSYKSNLHAK